MKTEEQFEPFITELHILILRTDSWIEKEKSIKRETDAGPKKKKNLKKKCGK